MTEDRPRHRLFVAFPLGAGCDVPLELAQAHYLGNVLRFAAGDAVAVFNGRDGEWRAEVIQIGRGRGSLRVLRQLRPQQPEPDLWLLFAPVKRTRVDFIAEKATELGASRVQPIFTRRTNVNRVNLDRLEANAREAAEQCGRLSLPEIAPAMTLSALLENWPTKRHILLCDETGAAPPARLVLGALPPGQPAAVLIGPEGGFEASELAALRQQSAVLPLSLGPRILRAETAAVAALALWQAHCGDWGGDWGGGTA